MDVLLVAVGKTFDTIEEVEDTLKLLEKIMTLWDG